MFKSPWRSIIWCGALALMLLSLITPFSIFTISFIIVPMLFLYVTLETRAFIIHIAITLVLVSLLLGGLGMVMLLFGLFFLVPAVIMGLMYKRQFPAHMVVLASIMTLLGELLLVFLFTSLLGFNLAAEIELLIRETYATLQEIMPQQFTDEMIDQQIYMMTQMIPTYMIMFAVYYAIITHWVGRKFLRRAGFELAGLPPVRTWQLPKSLVWIYVTLLVLSIFVNPDDSSMFTMVLFNVLPMLTFAFCVQGISFLFFIAHHKGWNKALPIVGIIVCIFASTVVSILGVFDIVLGLRHRIRENNIEG